MVISEAPSAYYSSVIARMKEGQATGTAVAVIPHSGTSECSRSLIRFLYEKVSTENWARLRNLRTLNLTLPKYSNISSENALKISIQNGLSTWSFAL